MTASDWRKALKQFRNKPVIKNKYIKHNKPKDRTSGIARKSVRDVGDMVR